MSVVFSGHSPIPSLKDDLVGSAAAGRRVRYGIGAGGRPSLTRTDVSVAKVSSARTRSPASPVTGSARNRTIAKIDDDRLRRRSPPPGPGMPPLGKRTAPPDAHRGERDPTAHVGPARRGWWAGAGGSTGYCRSSAAAAGRGTPFWSAGCDAPAPASSGIRVIEPQLFPHRPMRLLAGPLVAAPSVGRHRSGRQDGQMALSLAGRAALPIFPGQVLRIGDRPQPAANPSPRRWRRRPVGDPDPQGCEPARSGPWCRAARRGAERGPRHRLEHRRDADAPIGGHGVPSGPTVRLRRERARRHLGREDLRVGVRPSAQGRPQGLADARGRSGVG